MYLEWLQLEHSQLDGGSGVDSVVLIVFTAGDRLLGGTSLGLCDTHTHKSQTQDLLSSHICAAKPPGNAMLTTVAYEYSTHQQVLRCEAW